MSEIFIIGAMSGLKNRLDNNQYKLLKYISENSKNNVTLYEHDRLDDIKKNMTDDTILYFMCFSPEWVDEFPNIKIYDLWDLKCVCGYKCVGKNKRCGFLPILNYIKSHNFYSIWSRFDTYMTQYHFKDMRWCKFGYYIDENVFKDWDEEKEYDILMYGNVHNKIYPLRNRLYVLLNNSERFNVKTIPYSSRLRKAKMLVSGKELAKLINKSWMTISTKASIDAFLQKYYEIAMSKSAVCGDFPDLEMDQFLKHNMVHVTMDMSDEDILDTIERHLSDKKRLSDMIDKCYAHFMKNYTFDCGARDFDRLIKHLQQQ